MQTKNHKPEDSFVGVIAEKTIKGRPVRVTLRLEALTMRPFVEARSGALILARFSTPESFRKLSVLGDAVLSGRHNTVSFSTGFFFGSLSQLAGPGFGHGNNIVGFGAGVMQGLADFMFQLGLFFLHLLAQMNAPVDGFAPLAQQADNRLKSPLP